MRSTTKDLIKKFYFQIFNEIKSKYIFTRTYLFSNIIEQISSKTISEKSNIRQYAFSHASQLRHEVTWSIECHDLTSNIKFDKTNFSAVVPRSRKMLTFIILSLKV